VNKTVAILTLFFLLTFFCVPVCADTGSVKVISKDGKDITNENHEESDTKQGEEGGSEKTNVESSEDITINRDLNIKAAQTSFENALYGFTEGMVDSLYEGSLSMYEADLTDGDNGTVTYKIHATELKPFEHPIVFPVQVITFCFLILVTLIVILGSILISGFQTRYPESYGDLRRSVSGEYKPYNPGRVHSVCMWATTRPVLYFSAFLLFILGRNYIISSTLQSASGVLGSPSDNIIIRAITGAAMFVGSIQTSIGEFGVYTFGTLLFIICMITDVLVLKNAKGAAKNIELIAWGAFGLFCFCDLINMSCTSFGVVTSQWKEESIYISVGIMAGAFINGVILAAITIYAILKGKRELGV